MIEETIHLWVERHRLSSGDDLVGFIMDCDAYLADQDAFASANVKSTEEPLSMVNAVILIAPSVSNLQMIADAFKAAWTQIAYREFQAVSMGWYQEAMMFRFITGNQNSGLGVTGTFMASGDQYPQLVYQFRRDFAPLRARIDPIPGGLPRWAAQQLRPPDGGRAL